MSLSREGKAEVLCPSGAMGHLKTGGECGSPAVCASEFLFGVES